MSLNNEQWKNLTQAIRNNNCVLVMGPKLATDRNGKLLIDLLAEELAAEVARIDPNMYITDTNNLAHVAKVLEDSYAIQELRSGGQSKGGHVLLADKVCAFYAKHQEGAQEPAPIYNEIVKMGFSVIINTTPDRLLLDAYENAGNLTADKNFYYYHFANPQHGSTVKVSEKSVKKNTPLIYNLFGSTDNKDSLVLTEKDQLKFLDNILQQEATASIPSSVAIHFVSGKGEVAQKNFLFLGFDFENWQLRLLLQLFNRHQNNPIAFGLQNGLSGLSRFFYEKNFGFAFAETPPLEFLTELKKVIDQDNTPPALSTGLQLAILHHEEDHTDCQKLVTKLALLQNQKKLLSEIWGQDVVAADLDTAVAIQQKIDHADMVLLLVSSNFLADDDLYKYGERAINRGIACTVVPILIRPCDIENSIFNELPTICPDPNEEKAISQYDNVEEAWQETLGTIQKIAEKLLKRKNQITTP